MNNNYEPVPLKVAVIWTALASINNHHWSPKFYPESTELKNFGNWLKNNFYSIRKHSTISADNIHRYFWKVKHNAILAQVIPGPYVNTISGPIVWEHEETNDFDIKQRWTLFHTSPTESRVIWRLSLFYRNNGNGFGHVFINWDRSLTATLVPCSSHDIDRFKIPYEQLEKWVEDCNKEIHDYKIIFPDADEDENAEMIDDYDGDPFEDNELAIDDYDDEPIDTYKELR